MDKVECDVDKGPHGGLQGTGTAPESPILGTQETPKAFPQHSTHQDKMMGFCL